jgi:hypothetical protein
MVESIPQLSCGRTEGLVASIRLQDDVRALGSYGQYIWSTGGWKWLADSGGAQDIDGVKYVPSGRMVCLPNGDFARSMEPDPRQHAFEVVGEANRPPEVMVWNTAGGNRIIKSALQGKHKANASRITATHFVSPNALAWIASPTRSSAAGQSGVVLVASPDNVRELLVVGQLPKGLGPEAIPQTFANAKLVSNQRGQLLVDCGSAMLLWDQPTDSFRTVTVPRPARDVSVLDDGSIVWTVGQEGTRGDSRNIAVKQLDSMGHSTTLMSAFDADPQNDNAPMYTPVYSWSRSGGLKADLRTYWANSSGSRFCFPMQEDYIKSQGSGNDEPRRRTGVYTGTMKSLQPVLRVGDEVGPYGNTVLWIDNVRVMDDGSVWLSGQIELAKGGNEVAMWHWEPSGTVNYVNASTLMPEATADNGLAVVSIPQFHACPPEIKSDVCVEARLAGGGTAVLLLSKGK